MNGSCRAIAFGQEGQHAMFDLRGARKVIGCQHLPLKHAKNDFDLIQPRCVHGQPMETDGEAQLERANPAGQLLGGVGGGVVKNEM